MYLEYIHIYGMGEWKSQSKTSEIGVVLKT